MIHIEPSLKHSNPWFEAQTVQRQLQALAYTLKSAQWDSEFSKNLFFAKRIKKSQGANIATVRKLMINGWNTEYLLSINQNIVDQSGRAFVLHWAFPQAYYSVFGTLLAHFHTLGYSQDSHQGALRRFAQLVTENKLPAPVSVHCHGSHKQLTFYGVQPCNKPDHNYLNLLDKESIEHQICQCLKSTRKLKLMEKKDDLKLKTKAGKEKKSLSEDDWIMVSEKLGPTTILDFLYRKRIKSNYGEIDSYISEDFAGGSQILICLRDIVYWLNFVNEVYTAKAIGWRAFESLYAQYDNHMDGCGIRRRIVHIQHIVTG